ncbi:D-alanyl-D-alanine carboxypeptidase/D-alanyl-D-alanine-endopeptidase [Psychromonas sp. RZ22]|uniref:D-alanyl-D-alanine carboxypeptidase/D-alanyl-D-alanine endopeptidase n=1 Tax=Psychromonas algarum TaxID=2555643 RepID=UPI0010676887|nr:D-alanyl-D-alanine carboxypeptidase/D-alanyl-D-alanine-endopeptidase [Psychromonas sp. RZ22]TEW55582.1 D-alanyl-D-alanine carboxypeptidase/D-alanyl-D-alanine-endopeptidase [Psychromonas sp. RZ22]
MLKRYYLLFASLFCSSLFAATWQDLQSLLPKGTQVSYLVIDAQKQTHITRFQEETLRTPASIQKLLTATTAKLYLGKDFRYQTVIKGDKKALKGGRYNGDLTLYFTGDPTLGRADIRTLLQTLKSVGIKRIKGDFLLNNSHFNGYQWSNGQAWNDLGVCYTAPTNAIIINRNCVLGNLSLASPDAQKATLYIPEYEPVDITSNVSIVTKQQRDEQFCALEVTRDSQNKYHLWGCVVPRKRYFPLAFAVNDPELYAQQIIRNELKQVGITLTGKVKIDSHIKNDNSLNVPIKKTDQQSILASYQSPLLDVLLQEMMKDSDNLIADSLFKTIGAQYFKKPGNFRNGAKAMKTILKVHGIDLENAYIADGSGLSRHNLMSTELFMSVMQFVYAHDDTLGLIDSFSVAGVDGTLKYHKGVNTALLRGNVIAKTGSLKGVANLVGIVKSEQGDKLFVLMINGYNPKGSVVEAKIPRHEKASVYLFEKAFFEKILHGK